MRRVVHKSRLTKSGWTIDAVVPLSVVNVAVYLQVHCGLMKCGDCVLLCSFISLTRAYLSVFYFPNNPREDVHIYHTLVFCHFPIIQITVALLTL